VFGIKLDDEKNNVRGKQVEISSNDSKVKVWIIPTNEEIMIARDAKEIITGK
jgi:acetate kinase 2